MLDLVRDDAGRVSGGALNPAGKNQYNTPRLQTVARMDLAVARHVNKRPQCIESFADKVTAALADPENHLDLLRFVFNAGALEHALGHAAAGIADAPPTASSGPDPWSELSEASSAALPGMAELPEGAMRATEDQSQGTD